MDNQCRKVYAYMDANGSITRLSALLDLGVANLPARINELRVSGVEIETNMVTSENGKRFASYTLKK